ncbi:glycoside hydrolase family 95-like protein [Nonomuraea sp. 3N208]|uniref:glycoside hydrolase family 95-like protein n=1 Tax=Nonomuraea sp. 3N208 TaxID=3457421 RepID=UPI003FD0BD05
MLVQESGGTLRVFPAVPARWREAYAGGLRLPGALVVDARRENGRTTWIRVRGDAGGRVRLAHGIDGPVEVRSNGDWRHRGADTVDLRLRPGQTALVARRGAAGDLDPLDVAGTGRVWGLPENRPSSHPDL